MYLWCCNIMHLHPRVVSSTSTDGCIYIHRWCRLHPQMVSYTSTDDVIYIHRWCHLHPQMMPSTSTDDAIYIHRWCHLIHRWCHLHPQMMSSTSTDDVIYRHRCCHPTKSSWVICSVCAICHKKLIQWGRLFSGGVKGHTQSEVTSHWGHWVQRSWSLSQWSGVKG